MAKTKYLDDLGRNMKRHVLDGFSIFLFFIALFFIFDFRIYPYTDDWIYVSPLAFSDMAHVLKWAFTQHVDHMIPLQKLFHYFILRISGYDFRVAILLNATIALIMSLLMLRIAFLFRGEARWGDLIIPLLILNPAQAYSLWAFQFQFLSSIFFAVAFLYFSFSYLKEKLVFYLYACALALLLSALCGMNGLIFSITITIGCIFWFFSREDGADFDWKIFFLLVIIVGTQAILLLQWKPSAATNVGFQLSDALRMFVLLQASSFSVYMFSFSYLKSGLMLVCVLLIFSGALYKYKRRASSSMSVFLIFVLIASELVLLSISVGRNKIQGGWNGGLAMHYGMLAIFIPMLIWVFLGSSLQKKANILISALAITLAACVYTKGLEWRNTHEHSVYERQKEVERGLNTDVSLENLVNNYIYDFNWKNDRDAKEMVLAGLGLLRKAGYSHYRLFPDAFFSYGSSLPPKSADAGSVFPAIASQIERLDGWIIKGDYYRSEVEGYIIYGSYVDSDKNNGKILIGIQKGQSVYYRTGPAAENQRIVIITNSYRVSFPLLNSANFREIKFNGIELPEKFSVSFEDDGDEWGAWAAIAIHR